MQVGSTSSNGEPARLRLMHFKGMETCILMISEEVCWQYAPGGFQTIAWHLNLQLHLPFPPQVQQKEPQA